MGIGAQVNLGSYDRHGAHRSARCARLGERDPLEAMLGAGLDVAVVLADRPCRALDIAD